MKKYLLLLLVLCLGTSLLGQTRVNVYMKTGQQYKNVYLHEHEEEYVIINLNRPEEEEETLVKLFLRNIRSIRYLTDSKTAKPKVEVETFGFERGAYFAVEMGGITGKTNPGESNSTTLMLKGVAGYTPINAFGIGLGVGLDSYDDFTMLPVFLDIRGNFNEAKVMAYYYVQTGFSASWLNNSIDRDFVDEDLDSGWMISPGVGLRIDLGKSDVIVSMGYKHQKTKLTSDFEWGEQTIQERGINRMTFGFGLIF